MPKFLCYCPDYPNSLDRRLAVRAEHLVAAKSDLESGVQSELAPPSLSTSAPLLSSPPSLSSHPPPLLVLSLKPPPHPLPTPSHQPPPKTNQVVTGSPFLPRPGTSQRDTPVQDKPNIAGSYMIYQYDTLEQCLERLKADVYYTAGVWDKERMQVEELLG